MILKKILKIFFAFVIIADLRGSQRQNSKIIDDTLKTYIDLYIIDTYIHKYIDSIEASYNLQILDSITYYNNGLQNFSNQNLKFDEYLKLIENKYNRLKLKPAEKKILWDKISKKRINNLFWFNIFVLTIILFIILKWRVKILNRIRYLFNIIQLKFANNVNIEEIETSEYTTYKENSYDTHRYPLEIVPTSLQEKKIEQSKFPAINKENITKQKPQIKTKENIEVFYMLYPMQDYFYKPYITKSTESIYSFEKINESVANFKVEINGVPFQDVLDNIEKYIRPACQELNDPPLNCTNVITVEKGSVILEGDKWIIKPKAKIKYE